MDLHDRKHDLIIVRKKNNEPSDYWGWRKNMRGAHVGTGKRTIRICTIMKARTYYSTNGKNLTLNSWGWRKNMRGAHVTTGNHEMNLHDKKHDLISARKKKN